MPDSLCWFGVIRCTLQNFQFTIFKTLLLSQFSSDSSKLYTRYHNHTGCHFLGGLPKIVKLWHFEIFRNTGPYAAIIKVLFLPQFALGSIQTLDNVGYLGKSKGLLEYCN